MPKQNDERNLRQNAKSTVIGQDDARIISYAAILEMQRSRVAKADAKKAKADAKKAKDDAKKTKVPRERKRKVGPLIPTHEGVMFRLSGLWKVFDCCF